MSSTLSVHIKKNVKLQIFVVLTVILFLYKILRGGQQGIFYLILNELLALTAAVFLSLYMIEFIRSKHISPLSHVMNIGIVNAVLFFLVTFSDNIFKSVFSNFSEKIHNPGIILSFISLIYTVIILFAIGYIFAAFREMFFIGQKRNSSTYFNTMVVFFLLTAFSSLFKQYTGLNFIFNAFLIISVSLIVMNSIRISWIAFIVKREKIILLILSVVICVLFIVNLAYYSKQSLQLNMLSGFSSAVGSLFKLILIYGIAYFSILFFTTLFHIPTAEAFDRKAREVSSLQYFSSLITQVLDFKELADTISDIALKVCNASASWIVWKEEGKQNIIINKNIGFIDSQNISKIILDESSNTEINGTTIIELGKYKQKIELQENYRNMLIAPLKAHNEVMGYLFALKKDDYLFDEEDKNAVNTFAEYASVAVENSLLLKESIEKERLEKELDLAREIQRKLVPAKTPELDKLKISSTFIPAFEVGGDYYDFFMLDENRFGFIIADVSGKGISAAFIMAEMKGIIESLTKLITSPKEILVTANQILEKVLDKKNFISAAYGLIDMNAETLHISRAGHCPVLLIRNNKAEDIRPSGLGLGLNFTDYFSENLEERKIDLIENDILVLYTDGITEAKNELLEEFGEEKLQKIILENKDKNADEISNSVIREITTFSKNTDQHDDITLVILKWKEKIKFDGEQEWQNLTPRFQNKVK